MDVDLLHWAKVGGEWNPKSAVSDLVNAARLPREKCIWNLECPEGGNDMMINRRKGSQSQTRGGFD